MAPFDPALERLGSHDLDAFRVFAGHPADTHVHRVMVLIAFRADTHNCGPSGHWEQNRLRTDSSSLE
jgi:hypothetical protein